MELFIDSANIEEIKEISNMGILDGVTTNPTLLAKQLTNTKSSDIFKETKKLLSEICKTCDVPVLAEPVSTLCDEIVKESLELSEISTNIVSKIPLTEEGLKAAKILKRKNIKVAFTLIFSVKQALIAAASESDYICPFVGRLDDIGENGILLIENIMKVYKNYKVNTKVIVASIRNIDHIVMSAYLGADAVTIPFKLIEDMISHELTNKGIQKFLDDWKKIK
ncbi:MAG: fructose-6-phosphate aldolase [Endomicrobia bacterium]|nr:fructose-6-phosphate aldolase [Endomicrobiia bacterium]